MKKSIFITITLSMIALAAVFTFTHTTSAADRLLMENVEALADGWDSLQNLIDDSGGDGLFITCLVSGKSGDPTLSNWCSGGSCIIGKGKPDGSSIVNSCPK